MIKRVVITRVYKNEKKESGEAYVYKSGKFAGKNFVRIGIQTDETGSDTYYCNALLDSREAQIEEGQNLIIKFEETPKDDGSGTWKNFKFPNKAELEVFKQFDTGTAAKSLDEIQ